MRNEIVSLFQKVFKSPDERTRKIKYNVFISLLLKGVGILVSLLIVPLTLHYLSTYEYGVWLTISSIMIWITYFDIGLGNGLRNKLAEAIANNDWEQGRIYISTSFFVLAIIMALLIGLLFISNSYVDWNKILNTTDRPIPYLNQIVTCVLVLFCLSFVLKLVGVVWMALQLPAFNDLFLFLGSLLSLLSIYLLTLFTKGNLFYVAFAFSLAPLIVYSIAIPLTFRKYKLLKPGFNYVKLSYARGLMGLGVKFFIIQIACLVIFSTSNFLISHFFSPAEVTPYNIAFKYFNVLLMLFTIMVTPIWTAITDAYIKKEYTWIKLKMKTIMKVWGCCILLVLLMILLSKKIYYFWIGDTITIDFNLSVGMAMYVLVSTWNQIFATFVNGINKIKLQLLLAIVEAILFVPTAYLFSRWFGLVGMVYAMAFVLFISSVGLSIQYYLITRRNKWI